MLQLCGHTLFLAPELSERDANKNILTSSVPYACSGWLMSWKLAKRNRRRCHSNCSLSVGEHEGFKFLTLCLATAYARLRFPCKMPRHNQFKLKEC